MRRRRSRVRSGAPPEYERRLEVLPALQTIRNEEAERGDLRLHLGDVLAARFLVSAAFQAPFEVALGARRSRLPEHVEPDDEPLIDGGLRLSSSIRARRHQLLELLLAVGDVAL